MFVLVVNSNNLQYICHIFFDQVQHPAAKMLVLASQMQEQEVSLFGNNLWQYSFNCLSL